MNCNLVLPEVLLEHGLSLDCHNKKGEYPLGEALKTSINACELLLDFGASPNYCPGDVMVEAMPALHIALSYFNTDEHPVAGLCQLSLDHGADPMAPAGPSDETPMNLVINSACYHCAKPLRRYGSAIHQNHRDQEINHSMGHK